MKPGFTPTGDTETEDTTPKGVTRTVFGEELTISRFEVEIVEVGSGATATISAYLSGNEVVFAYTAYREGVTLEEATEELVTEAFDAVLKFLREN